MTREYRNCWSRLYRKDYGYNLYDALKDLSEYYQKWLISKDVWMNAN